MLPRLLRHARTSPEPLLDAIAIYNVRSVEQVSDAGNCTTSVPSRTCPSLNHLRQLYTSAQAGAASSNVTSSEKGLEEMQRRVRNGEEWSRDVLSWNAFLHYACLPKCTRCVCLCMCVFCFQGAVFLSIFVWRVCVCVCAPTHINVSVLL